jgi:hypothetical protein
MGNCSLMGMECQYYMLEGSGDRQWPWLHDSVNILNTTELYA